MDRRVPRTCAARSTSFAFRPIEFPAYVCGYCAAEHTVLHEHLERVCTHVEGPDGAELEAQPRVETERIRRAARTASGQVTTPWRPEEAEWQE
eukprot:8032546-Pyramimonas_sp.AAC.1